MAGWENLRCCFNLLLIFSLASVGLLFAVLEISPRRDIVKSRHLVSHLTTTPALVARDKDSDNASTKTSMRPQARKRQVLLIVAHGRSGSTFLADIFNKHPRVFYVFEPLHDFQKHNRDRPDYDEFAMKFLYHIVQCDFLVENSTRDIGRFYRFKSRVLSSPPFCKYKQEDPRWKQGDCWTVQQQDLEHACREHDITVYKLLMERIPGQSIDKLFEVCEKAGVECKVIHLVRDIRPLVMSSQKVGFFKEVDSKIRSSMRQFVYSRCEMTERNLNLVKEFRPSLRSRVTLVRFEDLAVEPLKVLGYLYKFAGLEVLENITNWVVKITQPSLKDLKAEGRGAVSVVRNSLEVLSKWRLASDFCYVHVVERYCRDVMKLMGYIATEGSVEMLQNLEIPLINETYQAQYWDRS